MQPEVEGDLSAMFQAKREASQRKRASNRDASTAILQEQGIFFTTHNDGVHLIVMDRWDFWPGTGKFKERRGRPGKPKREGRGVQRLINHIREDGDATAL